MARRPKLRLVGGTEVPPTAAQPPRRRSKPAPQPTPAPAQPLGPLGSKMERLRELEDIIRCWEISCKATLDKIKGEASALLTEIAEAPPRNREDCVAKLALARDHIKIPCREQLDCLGLVIDFLRFEGRAS